MAQLNLVQAVNDALRSEMQLDDRLVVLGEDVGVDGGVFRATEGLLKQFGPQRVLDTPLSEVGIVGSSIGMAAYGLHPVAEVQFSGFLPPAFDQIVSHAARIRWRSRGRYHLPLVVRAPYGGGIRSPEHHSESPEAFYAHVGGLKVVIPSTPADAKGLLISAIRDPDPVIFLEPKRIYRAFRQEVPEGEYILPLGKARIAREGDDLSLFAWGAMTQIALVAAEELDQAGISAEVVDLRTISPLDAETIVASVQKTGRALIVHEAPRQGGVGAEVATLINDKALMSLQAPVLRVAGFDTIMPLLQLEDYYLPDAGRVVRAARRLMAY